MYTLGIPNRQYRRATQILGPESADPINYDMVKQDDGFYLFSFPEIDEYDFRDIVMLLKSNGVTTIGADEILTERKIMKLTDLLKEQPKPSMDKTNLIGQLEIALKRWEDDKSPPYDRLDSCERSDQYQEDIKDIIDGYNNPLPSPGDEDKIEKDDEDLANFNDDFGTMQEQNKDSKNPGADPFQDLYDKQNPNDPKAIPGKHFPNTKKIKLKLSNIESEVTIIDWKEGKNQLEDVTISWDTTTGTESHEVTFDQDPDAHMECLNKDDCETEFMAESEDGMWQFILDVNVPENYEESGTIIGWDWEELIIQEDPDNEDHLDPEDRSDFEDEEVAASIAAAQDDINTMEEGKFLREQLQKRAGIIK